MIRRLATFATIAVVLAACGSRAPATLPATRATAERAPLAAGGGTTVTLAATRGAPAIALGGPARARIALHAADARSRGPIVVGLRAHHRDDDRDPCEPFPSITLGNPSGEPIVLDIDSMTFEVEECTPSRTLYGISAYQSDPMPATVAPLKLGDVTIRNETFTFTSSVVSLTLPPHATTDVSALAEDSTAEVAVPVAPGATTVLSANAPSLPRVAFSYAAASGASLYGVACFDAFDAHGTLAAALRGLPLLGTPRLYCRFDPSDGAITFGTTATFAIDFAKRDVGLIQLDGPTRTAPCTSTGASSEVCSTTALPIGFDASDYRLAIVGNARDLAPCAPADANADCNAGAAKATHFPTHAGSNQLLLANDATYRPPFFGGYALTVAAASAGVCRLNVGPDVASTNPDEPGGYYDPQALPGSTPGSATYPGDATRASAEFDVTTLAAGTCTIDAAETTGLRRRIAFTIPVR